MMKILGSALESLPDKFKPYVQPPEQKEGK